MQRVRGALAALRRLRITRGVESFDYYLIDALSSVFYEKPQMLISEGAIEVKTILEADDKEQIVEQIVERKLQSLAFASLDDKATYIKSRLGLIFSNAE